MRQLTHLLSGDNNLALLSLVVKRNCAKVKRSKNVLPEIVELPAVFIS